MPTKGSLTRARLIVGPGGLRFAPDAVQNAMTAKAGGGQASHTAATTLILGINRVTTVTTAADSVLLPEAKAGMYLVVTNAAAANSMNMFPAVGDNINALADDAALAVAANKTVILFCAVDTTWNTVLTA